MKDKNNMSPSDLAKLVWGTTKDRRGYTVARNRDRIGHYLAGTSYPDPANLERIAEVLDVPVEELAVERPPRPPVTPRTFVSHHSSDTAKVGTLILTSLPTEQPQLTKIRLQVDLVLPWKLATEIQQKLLNRTETETEAEREEPPQLGTVIHGSKP
jgi:transcriptional regulator with XRE-family HTH domain